MVTWDTVEGVRDAEQYDQEGKKQMHVQHVYGRWIQRNISIVIYGADGQVH
jgi:hypothetical protein